MKIGAMNNPSQNTLDEIDWIGRNGFDFVDLTVEPPQSDIENLDSEKINCVLEKYHLGVVVHTPSYLPIAHPYSSIRNMAVKEGCARIDFAAAVGASIITVHFYEPPTCLQEYTVAWHLEALLPLSEYAGNLDIMIALEHNPRSHGSRQLAYVEKIVEAAPQVGVQLDSGHCFMEEEPHAWETYVKRFNSRIVHVHLSENDGMHDQHLPIGCKLPDWPHRIRVLREIGYDGTITLEGFTPAPEYALVSKELLHRWWSDVEVYQ